MFIASTASMSGSARLRHRAALLVVDPAVLDDSLVRRGALDRNAGQERAAEPAAELIAAFEIHVARPRHAVVPEHGEMRHARFEPDVDDILLFFKPRAAAVRTVEARRQIRLDRIDPPRTGADLGEALRHVARDVRIENRFVARGADDRGNRRAPDALARDAPLGMVLDHLALTHAAPLRHVVDAVDGFDRARAQPVLIHRDEPLRGGAEDHRVVAAPAVRIRVLVIFRAQRARRSRAGPRRSALLALKMNMAGVRSGFLR